MIDSYDGGYIKALLDLEEIVLDYDLWFFKTFNKDTRTGTKSSYLTKANFPTLVNFFMAHTNALMTWGSHIEFKAKVGGELEMVSVADGIFCTSGYREGYKTALKDVSKTVMRYTGTVNKKSILSIIKYMMEAPYDPCKIP